MSADKHKSLASRAAYLRMAIQREGFSINVKWAHALTPFIMRMIDDGELVMRRQSWGGRKSVSTIHATPTGVARLAALEQRFGAGFGSNADIGRVEPKRIGRTARRKAAATPEPRHVITARKTARRIRMIAMRAEIDKRLRENAAAIG